MSTLDTVLEDIKQFQEFVAEMSKHTAGLSGLAVEGLGAIARIATGSTADTAIAAIGAINAVIKAVTDGLSGRVTPDEARKALASLRTDLEKNDAKADADLAARFDDGAP